MTGARMADEQLPRAFGALGFGRILSGILGAGKPRSKGHVGEASTLNNDSQSKRWVERGKEHSPSASNDLPPPPMTNYSFHPALPIRRDVSQHYKIKENLRVTASTSADGFSLNGMLPNHPFLPMPSARCGASFLMAPLQHLNEGQLLKHLEPPAACSSDCNSMNCSSLPSTRSSSESVHSLANGVSGSSSSSSACGSTDDTACSPEVADHRDLHEFLVSHPPTYSQGDMKEGKFECIDSVSILCTVDSGLLVAKAVAEGNGVDAVPGKLAAVEAAGGAERLVQVVQQQQRRFPNCEALLFSGAAQGDSIDGCAAQGNSSNSASNSDGSSSEEGGTVLSRSSSLALSLADLAQNDSLPEAELLLLIEPQLPPSLQQPQQPQQQRQHESNGNSYDFQTDHSFSFPAVFAAADFQGLCCVVSSTDAESRKLKEPLHRDLKRYHRQRQDSSPHDGQQDERYQATPATGSSCSSSSSSPSEQVHLSPAPRRAGRNVGIAAAVEPCASGLPGPVMDLTTIESAVELLKQLRGSLVAAGSSYGVGPHVLGPKVSCSGATGGDGSGSSSAAQVPSCRLVGVSALSSASASIIGASLAQAAQKLAGLGLLSAPLNGRGIDSGSGKPAVPVTCCVSAVGTAPAPVMDAPKSSCPLVASCLQAQGVPMLNEAPGYLRTTSYPGMLNQAAAPHSGQDSSGGAAGTMAAIARARDEGMEGGNVAPRYRELLRRMQADWSRVQEQIGGIVDDYTALAKQVAATVAKQVVLERCCAAVESAKVDLVRQLKQERAQREALEQQLVQERVAREALTQHQRQQMEQEHEQQQEYGSPCQSTGGDYEWELQSEQVAVLRMEMDELLLCLGQESSKVAALGAALRAAGGDPEPVIESVESEFVGREVGCA